MAAYSTIKKVKLKDPETLGESAAILYPLTGINAIMAGTSGDAANTYIASAVSVSSGGVSTTLYKIKPEHLGIIDSGGKVDNSYLSFITDGYIDDNMLRFITSDSKISQDYLPSYVDDVIDVPVVNAPNNADHAAYQLEIQASVVGSSTVYKFKQWNGSQWVEGGGQGSTI